jgi:hypothetical protein
MKNIQIVLLASLAAVTVGMAGLGAGCGGDDTSSGGTGSDGGGKDQQVADQNNQQDTAPPDVNQPDTAPPPLATGQIDRMGRAGINTLLVNKENKQPYNKAAGWGDPPAFALTNFSDHLHAVDLFDGTKNWTDTDAGVHPLAAPFGGANPYRDILIVDPKVGCPDKGSYLDIEFFVLGFYAPGDGGPSAPYTTCGGRTPNDDVIDHSLSALVLGPAGATWTPNGGSKPDLVRDCVDQATTPANIAAGGWPYLIKAQ